MGQAVLVTEDLAEGGALVREFNRYAPVSVAFWMWLTDEDRPYLYISSDHLTSANIDVGYGEVIRLCDLPDGPAIDPFQVTLIAGTDPRGRDAMAIGAAYAGQRPRRLRSRTIGGMLTEEVYIYPPVSAAPVVPATMP